jgi:hypothetical protein
MKSNTLEKKKTVCKSKGRIKGSTYIEVQLYKFIQQSAPKIGKLVERSGTCPNLSKKSMKEKKNR